MGWMEWMIVHLIGCDVVLFQKLKLTLKVECSNFILDTKCNFCSLVYLTILGKIIGPWAGIYFCILFGRAQIILSSHLFCVISDFVKHQFFGP